MWRALAGRKHRRDCRITSRLHCAAVDSLPVTGKPRRLAEYRRTHLRQDQDAHSCPRIAPGKQISPRHIWRRAYAPFLGSEPVMSRNAASSMHLGRFPALHCTACSASPRHHISHINTGTGPTPATSAPSAPELGSPFPPSAPGLGPPRPAHNGMPAGTGRTEGSEVSSQAAPGRARHAGAMQRTATHPPARECGRRHTRRAT